MTPVRVFIVDDTAVVRRLLTQILEEERDMLVVGTAANGAEAMQRLPRVEPDIVILDIEMPDMNGLEMLKVLRASGSALPVLVFSTVTERGAMVTIDALLLGANDYVTKPSMLGSAAAAREHIRQMLVPRLRQLLGRQPPVPTPSPSSAPSSAPVRLSPLLRGHLPDLPPGPVDVVVIGVSTGGPNALSELMPRLPANLPVPLLVVQHMPAFFTRALALRLDAVSALQVCECTAPLRLEPGRVVLATGGRHMVIEREGDDVLARPDDAPAENFCRPAADVLFRSAVESYGARVLGIVLTGMGQDGEAGSRAIRERGGHVLVQDRASCVVWGMPAAVEQAGLASKVVPLAEMAAEIVARVSVSRPWYEAVVNP
ncbi:MAG: chemotaxis response regulator protein-glutamate methylesterase [Moraxellaceae bacterium]|nr:chemotaxis response regulator protein-glutamate methylesterase [Moraxellaceae bacterium]